MEIKRRDFFKIVSAGSIALLPSGIKAQSQDKSIEFNDSIGVLVDTAICIGCRKCEWGCNKANGLPVKEIKEYDDKSVFERHRRPTENDLTVVNVVVNPNNPEKPFYTKVQCMHCNYPACVSACIVGAFEKTKEGPVIYDPWKCMGCRYCMVACPFQIPAYEYSNAFDPEVRKCTFCFDKISEGKRPGCVEACPNEALTFGKRIDLLEMAHERIMQHPEKYVDHIYGEHEAGGTNWLYLSGVDFTRTELPTLDSKPIPELTEKIQHGIFKSFVPPIILYGLLGLAMHVSKDKQVEKVDSDERL